MVMQGVDLRRLCYLERRRWSSTGRWKGPAAAAAAVGETGWEIFDLQ